MMNQIHKRVLFSLCILGALQSAVARADWKDSFKNFLNKPNIPVGESTLPHLTILNLLKMQRLIHNQIADKGEKALLAKTLDFGFHQKDLEFTETYLIYIDEKRGDEENRKKMGPLTMGEALVENERLHQDIAPDQVIAYIETDITSEKKALGRFQIAWHPSKSFYLLASSLIYFPMNRAYLSPDFLRKQFPEYFEPEYHNENFKINKIDGDSHIGLFVSLTYHGDPVTNKTIFNFELNTDDKTILPCKSQLETDYNPSAPEFHLKGNLSCVGLILSEGPQ
jgi:hypothetical protein